nr:reverse transcriptase domain-containing protein [Tanacetum cinerariifolium]
MSIQEMEDLKQQYLDEMKRFINSEYRDEIKINELKENFNSMSIEINKKEKLHQLEQVANLSTYLSKRFNSFCYDDDNDDYAFAITPNKPDYSLKSDEFIKSSVENLLPIPSEPEGESECDSFYDEDVSEKIFSKPLFEEDIITMKIDQHHYNAESDLIESLRTHDSSLIISSKIDSLLDEFAGELTLLKSILPGIDETDCDPEEEIRLIERLLYANSSPHLPKEFVFENSDTKIESFSPSPIPVKDGDSLMEEIDLSFALDYPMPSSIKDDDYDLERDILILKDLPFNDTLSLPEIESFHFDIPSFSRPPAKPPDGNTGILNIKMMGDISEQKVPMPKLMITLASNQEKSPDLLSHQGLKTFQPSAKYPMIIHGKNTHILRRNKRRTPNVVEPELRTIVEMVDNRTIEELLQAPTEGYGEAVVIPEINADHFKIKTNLLQLVQANPYYGFERQNPHTHINNFKRITSTLKFRDVPNDMFKLMMFPYSLEGNARVWYDKEPPNSILTWEDLTFGEAWKQFKEMLRACPHIEITKLAQIDTFYNGLYDNDQDSLNAAAGGNLLSKTTREASQIIENKSKVRYSINKSNVSRMNTTSRENVSKTDDRIDKLADQISTLVDIFAKKVVAPAPVKAVEESYVTCGGNHAYYNCPNTDSNQPNFCVMMGTYNQVAPQNRASNFMAPSTFARKIAHIQPSVTPIPEPDVPKTLPKPNIPYPSRLNDQKLQEKAMNQIEKFFQIFQDLHFDINFTDALLLMPKFASTIKSLLTNKDKLFELAKISLNENWSAMLLKKLPEKVGDPGKFLIPCDFPGMDICHALANLGASINLLPLFIWKKLSLPELTPTRMTLELADRSITRPKGVAKDVFVKVRRFYFLIDFVVMDFKADPRVPLILGRSFLRTGRALIDVYGEEITLWVNDEAREVCLGNSWFSSNSSGGNPTSKFKPILFNFSPSLTPFEGCDFILEEIDAYLKDESILPEIDHADCDSEGDICLIEKLLNDDPFQLPPMDLKQREAVKAKSSIEEPPKLELKELPSHLEYAYLEDKMSRDVITVGSTMRISLLYRGEYSQWRERFMNYLEEQTDGEAMINSIQNEEKTRKIDHLARSLLIQGLLNEIYSLIDSNKTAKDLWDALERQMHGSKYGEQDRKAAILYEYETFKAIEGEKLLDTYLCYLQVINDLKKCGYKKNNCELNYKFLNNLKPEWKQYGTLMRQTKNLMDINIDALYNILKQNQGDVNDALGYKKKDDVVTSDPLVLVAEKTKMSKQKEKVVVSLDSKGSGADDFSELKKITTLLAKAFTRRKFYSKPTNNNLRSSSSSHSDSDKEINANMVFMAQIEKVLSDSDESSSFAEETIAEVAYYTSESKSWLTMLRNKGKGKERMPTMLSSDVTFSMEMFSFGHCLEGNGDVSSMCFVHNNNNNNNNNNNKGKNEDRDDELDNVKTNGGLLKYCECL